MHNRMTEGSPLKLILMFAMPVLLGNVFQQFYNMADTMMVGRILGVDALAAMGATASISGLVLGLNIGLAQGFAIPIAQYVGAGDMDKVRKAVAGTLMLGLIFVLGITLAALLTGIPVLKLLGTPEEIMGMSVEYIFIIYGGLIITMMYNMAASILRSYGDSRTPLYFLIGSSIGNILLDTLFVAGFHWGVAGVAWATFLAQGVACVLALVTLKRRLASVETTGKAALFSWNMLGKISRIAVPSILQQSFISIGNIFIQGLINSFGSSVIAGYSAAIKLNTFAITSLTTLGNGTSSFTAQNLGAGKQGRVKAGFGAAVKLALIITVPFFVAFFFGSHVMLSLFMNEGSTVAMETGMEFLKIVSPFYFVISLKLMADGVLRGAGAMKSFMIATFSDLLLRVILAFILAGPFGTLGIWLSWPIGWMVAMVLSLSFYKKGVWKSSALTDSAEDMEEAPELETEGALMFMEEENA